ncbi:hypothetical protein LCGC14_1547160 [marine sediment metagenome]|uniref:Uncharacterized protein n=1 Tax=marine sediment metagenome TaxID=412755 RepID=A0A0F9IRB3_9ZZZZ
MAMEGKRLYADTYLLTGQITGIIADGSTRVTISLEVGTSKNELNAFDGIVRGLKVACGSTNFDISLFTKSDGAADSIYEIVAITASNKSVVKDDYFIVFENRDIIQAKAIYLSFDEQASEAPGTIDWELTINAHKLHV